MRVVVCRCLNVGCSNEWLVDKSRIFRSNKKDVDFFGGARNDVLLLRRYFMDFIQHLGVRLGLRQRVIATAQVFWKRFYLSNSFVQYDPRLATPTMLYVAAKVEECLIDAKIIIGKLGRMDVPSLAPRDNLSTLHGGTSTPSGSSTPGSLPNASIAGLPQVAPANSNTPTVRDATCIPMPSPALINLSGPTQPTIVGNVSSAAPSTIPYLYDLDDMMEMEFAILVGLKYDLIVYHPYRPLMQSVKVLGWKLRV